VIRLWDVRSGACLAILQQHSSDMHALALSADGKLLAAVGKDERGRQVTYFYLFILCISHIFLLL